MLHVEYYPDDEIPMDEDLMEAMKRMADFTVAYENLLRYGKKTVEHNVSIDGYNSSAAGEADAIWCYTREDATYEICRPITLSFQGEQDDNGKCISFTLPLLQYWDIIFMK